MNIFYQSSLEVEAIWNVVKEIKLNHFSKSCVSNTGLINKDATKSAVSLFKQKLQVKDCGELHQDCELINTNFTNTNLTKPAEMFFFLVFCSKSLDNWFRFYEHLLRTQSPDHLLLTINKVLKSTKSKGEKSQDIHDIAAKIFEKISSLFSLKFKTMKNIAKGFNNLSEYDNETWKKITGI